MNAQLTPDFSAYSFDSVAVNMIVVWVIQKMKLSDAAAFRWISEATPGITKALAALAAALTAAGMLVQWTVDQGSGTLTISGITLTAVANFVWMFLKNWVFQEGTYKLIFKAPVPMELPAVPKDGKG